MSATSGTAPESGYDGLVAADMQISSIVSDPVFVITGYACEIFSLSGPDDAGRSQRFGIGNRLFDPGPGIEKFGSFAIGHKVQRHHCKLKSGAALNEQNVMAIRDSQHVTDIGNSFIVDIIVMFSPVTHFDEGHSRPLVIYEIGLGFFQGCKWQGAWTGRKVENSIGHVPPPLLLMSFYLGIIDSIIYTQPHN
jgi:hypothetical protein